jgi:hypothetical protein
VREAAYTLEQALWLSEKAGTPKVRRLAHTAAKALERADLAERKLLECEQRLAIMQCERRDYILLLLYRDGSVEVWSSDWRPVKFAHVPNLIDQEAAIDWAVRGLPRCYAELATTDVGRLIAFDSTKGCLSSDAFARVRAKLEDLAMFELLKELAKPA